VACGDIIEQYPTDKYGSSCLIYGTTRLGWPIHVQCTQPVRPKVKIVTVYEPDSEEWSEFRRRR